MANHYDKQFKLDAVQRHYHAGRKNCVKQVILKAVVPVTMLLMKQKKSHD